MMIRSLHIERLFDEFDYNLDLCDRLTFLHSPNGYGKSTLMHLLYSALKGDTEYLSGTPFDRMDVCFEDDTCLIIENESGKLRLQMQRSDLVSTVTPEEMGSLREVHYIPPERLMIPGPDGTLLPALATYSERLSEQIRYAKDHTELAEVPRRDGPERTDGDLEIEAKDLKAKLEFMKDAGFEPDIPAGLRFPPSRYELSTRREDYEALIDSVSDYVDRNYTLAESVIIFKDIVNDIFINKNLEVTDSGKMAVTMNNGSSLQLQCISSGERQILILFYRLLFEAGPGSLVIVDEPEISLHVSWQQKLGDFFLDICRVRDLQMIVATHSPTVIHDKWDMARELKVENA